MDAAEALVLIEKSEDQYMELKTSFAEQRKAIQSLCAFANADGGTVFIGVKPDREVVGVNDGLGSSTLDDFANSVVTDSNRELNPTIEILTLQGKTVVRASVSGHKPGEFFMVYGSAQIRVGATNQYMTAQAIRARILEVKVSEGLPKFDVIGTGSNSGALRFKPIWRLDQVAGDPVVDFFWRYRGPRFSMEWKPGRGAKLTQQQFSREFDLSTPLGEDNRIAHDQIGFEIRFEWHGQAHHELHKFPFNKGAGETWDVGRELNPPDYWNDVKLNKP